MELKYRQNEASLYAFGTVCISCCFSHASELCKVVGFDVKGFLNHVQFYKLERSLFRKKNLDLLNSWG